MNIIDIVDIEIPPLDEDINFYIIDPESLSFIRFDNSIIGANNFDKKIPIYLISNQNISELKITTSSSTNIYSIVSANNLTSIDISSIQNNNIITVNNVLSGTPILLYLFIKIIDNEYDIGEINLIWEF